ncbi:4455_t:CDS:2 [Funneliformis mosseae]|uniref:4455_t:CDS:1 n=1 Tax=Funneliformis mosseae TaxID=27381 RepID=A0A9N9BWV9_FUNMO|nr:4455_t:CDS:2 [Funneliformis mosseae]
MGTLFAATINAIKEGVVEAGYCEELAAHLLLLQIKNHKEKRVDSNFPNSAVFMLTPVYAGLEYEKLYLPFLLLYMSLGVPNPDFQIVYSGMELREDEEKLAYGNYVESNKNRIRRIRYQILLAIFGISDNIFGCINAKKSQLLVNLTDAWPDPIKLYTNEEDV